jgi:tripartite ATP-independent transporter DctP family solute receptor
MKNGWKAAIGALVLLVAAGGAAAQTKLKFAHVYETSEPYHTAALWAAGEIAKRTNNRYTVEVFPASTLGKETDINQGLTLGTVDIIYTGQLFAGRTYGPVAIGGAPYMFRDFAHWKAFSVSPLFSELSEGYRQKSGGNKIVAITYYGERHVTSNKPINKPEDMKGLKIRVPDAPLYTMFPRAVGANPTPIAFAEVYLALQNGTVDAQENPLPTIDAKKFYEVQKYIVLTGHITDALLTIVGGPTWNKLSEADRKTFEAVLREAAERATGEIVNIEKNMAAEFEKRGKTVVRVDRKPFREVTVKLHNGPDATWPKDVYDKLQALK